MFSSLSGNDQDDDILPSIMKGRDQNITKNDQNDVNGNLQNLPNTSSSETSIKKEVSDFSLVVDFGSSFTRCGFSQPNGFDRPSHVFPSAVGRPKHVGIMIGMEAKDSFVGDEATEKRGILSVKYPIQHGFVTNWNDLEKILNYIYNDRMKISSDGRKEHRVVLSETPLNRNNNREKITSIMFESYEVPSLFLGNRATLSLLGNGETSGIAVGIGDSVTSTVPIFEGHSIEDSILRKDIGGRDITETLTKLINEKHRKKADDDDDLYELFSTREEIGFVKKMKEEFCCIPFDYENAMESNERTGTCVKFFTLPDQNKIKLETEVWTAPEIVLFGCKNPYGKRVEENDEGGSDFYDLRLHEMIFESLMSVKDEDKKIELLKISKIVLWGGSTLFPGMIDRIRKEMNEKMMFQQQKKLVKWNRVEVVSRSNQQWAAWRGGVIVSNDMQSFRDYWIDSQEYDDVGAGIIHRKRFT